MDDGGGGEEGVDEGDREVEGRERKLAGTG